MIGRCVANRPYMYLPLKGDTNDYSVNAQNPSNTGVATTTGIFGETDGAYNWADGSDRLEWSSSVGNAVATKINNAMTLCFWSYKNFGAADYPRYLSQFSSTTGQNAFIFRFAEDAPTYDNTIVLSSSSSGTTLTNASITNNITTYNAWEFVVNSFSDTTTDVAVQIYIDGLLKVSSNLPYAKTDSSLVMRIGATLASNIQGDVGKIADYRIYSQKLSAGSLKILNNEKGRIRA